MKDSRNSQLLIAFETLGVFILAFAARAVFLDHEPIHDELQHLLAARSWLQDGTFEVAGGEYTRGALYTLLLAAVYGAFDMSTTAARMLSVVLGTLWVVGVFLWCRIRVGGPVAWIAALLFAFAPGAIFLSQYIRFYTLHGLMFWLGAIAVYELVERPKRLSGNLALAGVAAAALGIAAHLQPITLIGAVGLALFVTIRLAPTAWQRIRTDVAARRWFIAACIASAVVGVVAIVVDLPQKLLEMYLWSPLWSRGGGPLRYHWMLVGQYPLLWSVLPIAAVVVFAGRNPAGMFSACVFGTAILIHSFAGMKAERFIYYAMPCFFVLSAILIVQLAPTVNRYIDGLAARLDAGPLRSAARTVMVGAIAAFMVFSNPAIRTTADILRGQGDEAENSDAPWARYQTDWSGASAKLRPLLQDSAVVVTSQGLHLLYHFERLDIELSASRLSDLYVGKWDESKEFMIDRRTGAPVISSSQSFERIRNCFPTGTVIVHDNAWGNKVFVSPDVADSIASRSNEVDWGSQYGLKVFRWAAEGFEPKAECDLLPPLPDFSGARVSEDR